MKKFVSVMLAVIMFAGPALASAPYTYNSADGYYYGADGLAYTRKDNWEWVPGYYSGSGCYRCYKAGYYKFTYYSYTAVAKAVTYRTPGWRDKLIDIAAAREESDAFINAVQVMGLARGVAAPPTYAAAHYGVSGQTVYQATSVRDVYGLSAENEMILMQQAAALGKDQMAYGDRGREGFMALVEKRMAGSLAVAELIAKGQVAAQVLNAARPEPRSSTTTTETYINPNVNPSPRPTFNTGALTPGRQAAIASCVECHTGSQAKGGYQVAFHWTLTPADQMKVVERLVAEPADPIFMPQAKGGGPGKRLSTALILEFMPPSERARLLQQ